MAAAKDELNVPEDFLINYNKDLATSVRTLGPRAYRNFISKMFESQLTYFGAVIAITRKLAGLPAGASYPVNLAHRGQISLSKLDIPKIAGLYKEVVVHCRRYIRVKRVSTTRKETKPGEFKSVYKRMLASTPVLTYFQTAPEELGQITTAEGDINILDQTPLAKAGMMVKLLIMNYFYIRGYIGNIMKWQDNLPNAAAAKAHAAGLSTLREANAHKNKFSGGHFAATEALKASFNAPAIYTFTNGKKVPNDLNHTIWEIMAQLAPKEEPFNPDRISLTYINRLIALTFYGEETDVPAERMEQWAHLMNPATAGALLGELAIVSDVREKYKGAHVPVKKALDQARKHYKARLDVLKKSGVVA